MLGVDGLVARANVSVREQIDQLVGAAAADDSVGIEPVFPGDRIAQFGGRPVWVAVQFVEAGQNQYARKFLLSLRRLTLPITRKVMREESNRAAWIANWEAVLAAIERGDSREADEVARRWIMAVYDKDREIAEDEPPGSPYSATAGANQTGRQMKLAAGTSIKRG